MTFTLINVLSFRELTVDSTHTEAHRKSEGTECVFYKALSIKSFLGAIGQSK